MCLKERMLGFLPRLEKPQALFAEGKVHPVLGKEGLFVVESQEGKGHYLVDLEAETCTCPAFAQGKMRPCKHHFRDNAMAHTILRRTLLSGCPACATCATPTPAQSTPTRGARRRQRHAPPNCPLPFLCSYNGPP